ncbi:MAG TPA: helix-turn-helix domain-containing protein [Solirubrobacteraceae bacterium]|jgi:DNA-binding HxlR family transcriptional regulator|nr:helix-turn-helix domain-containing protein [Solirubrobacteraceae bacterium]
MRTDSEPSEPSEPEANRPAAVRQALEVFRDPWSFAVLQEAFFGVRRFDELQRNLGISRSVLTRRLGHLVENGVLERRRYQRRPDRYEYRLTARGLDMYPIFLALRTWGERWLENRAMPGPRLIHERCDHVTAPQMVCDHCGETIRAHDVRYEASGD